MPDKGGMEQCVPIDALAMPDDQEQMQPPAVGDAVNYQVDGKITRIDGQNAYVMPTAVNGQQMADMKEQEPDQEGALRQEAQEMDDSETYA